MALHYGILRKYTLGLLNLFNDLEIQYLNSDKVTTTTKKIPIKYSSREKNTIFSEYDTKQILEGNYNILPRANISMGALVKSPERVTNKFNKINVTENGEVKEFTYNAVPYNITYELTIQCRGMNEAGMIIEQVASRFNPNITMRINEVPNQTEPTSIPIQLLDITLEQSEYEEISTNIVNIEFGLELRGNIYQPIRTLDRIKDVELYVNSWHQEESNEYNRATLLDWDIEDDVVRTHSLINNGEYTKIVPEVISIDGPSDVTVNSNIILKVIYNDYDNKDSELTYNWNVTGSATIEENEDEVILTGVATEVINLSVSITDIHGNVSNTVIKEITVI